MKFRGSCLDVDLGFDFRIRILISVLYRHLI